MCRLAHSDLHVHVHGVARGKPSKIGLSTDRNMEGNRYLTTKGRAQLSKSKMERRAGDK